MFRTYKSFSSAERDKGPKSSSGRVYLVKSLENIRSLPVQGGCPRDQAGWKNTGVKMGCQRRYNGGLRGLESKGVKRVEQGQRGFKWINEGWKAHSVC